MSYLLIAVSIVVIGTFTFFFMRSKMMLRRDHEKKLGRKPTHKMETIKGEEAKNLINEKEKTSKGA